MLDAGFVNVQKYADDGWLTGLKYADEIESDLEKEADCEEGKLKKVKHLYDFTSRGTFMDPAVKNNIVLQNNSDKGLFNEAFSSFIFRRITCACPTP